MLRFVSFITLATTWLLIGIAMLLAGVVLGSLVYYPCISTTAGGYDCREINHIIATEWLQDRIPNDSLDTYLFIGPALFTLIGFCAIFVALQILDLTLRRHNPNQATMAIGFGVFFVILVLTIRAFLGGEIKTRAVDARQLVCAENLPASINISEATNEPGCLIPPANPDHPFYTFLNIDKINQLRRGLVLLSAWILGLSLVLLSESTRPPTTVQHQLERYGEDVSCERCGAVPTDGETTPLCILCMHYFEPKATIHDAQTEYKEGDTIRLDIEITPKDNIPMRNAVITLRVGQFLNITNYPTEKSWEARPNYQGSVCTQVEFVGPKVIATQQTIPVTLNVHESVQHQRRAKQAAMITIEAHATEYSAIEAQPIKEHITLVRPPSRLENMEQYMMNHAKRLRFWQPPADLSE